MSFGFGHSWELKGLKELCHLFLVLLYDTMESKEKKKENDLLLGQPSLGLQFGQKISLLIMRRSKRSVSDFSCSDECKQTVSEGTRSCAKHSGKGKRV